MEKVLLYWSNICVLHKHEVSHIENVRQKLLAQNIDLEVRYFGIGYPYRLSSYLELPEAVLPDVMISTDLEVYENSHIFTQLASDLYDWQAEFPLKTAFAQSDLHWHAGLIPFAVIPLIFYGTVSEQQSLQTIIHQPQRISFGGIHNSAAPCVFKAMWSHFGRETALALRDQATVTAMPIQAFQQARLGQTDLALIPSIYARRADGISRFALPPTEGAIALPSYACARRTISRETALLVLKELLSPDFCRFLVENGDLICPLKDGFTNPRLVNVPLLYPTAAWFRQVTPEDFADFYAPILQTA